jgi:hypothetical protein
MAARREPARVLAMTTQGGSHATLDSNDRHKPLEGLGMSQIRITKQRRTSTSARRREQVQQELPLDPRDPDITAAKQVQRRRTWVLDEA